MKSRAANDWIKVLVADDDERILGAYRDAFTEPESTKEMKALDVLAAELFDLDETTSDAPRFDIVVCSQGNDAVSLAREAVGEGEPFDVVILDVRMPPGIDGVQAGSEIRKFDPNVEIVFVSGFSDVPLEELRRRVPPPAKLHYFSKPLSFAQLAQDVATLVRSP